MITEPLKGKLFETMKAMYSTKKNPYGEIDAFRKEDVASAVEWLKEELKKTMKHQKEVKGNIWDYTVVGDLIDKAFEDVMSETKGERT